MEIPQPLTATEERLGWSCASASGSHWSCNPISTVGDDFADPQVADTHGDPCRAYGNGITLAALLRSAGGTVVYHSTDGGRTWTGPVAVPQPNPPGANAGSKIFFDGRTFVGYRRFLGNGEFVTRLGTAGNPCQWSPVTEVPGGDHPRMAQGATPGTVAVRSVTPGSLFGGSDYSFYSFDKQMNPVINGAPMASTTFPSLLPAFCTSDGTCRSGVDASPTLVYDPANHLYIHVWTDRPTGQACPPECDLVTRYNYSADGGVTWSHPVLVAGSGAAGSLPGASSFEPILSWDPVLRRVVMAYMEKPSKNSYQAQVRVQVLSPDGTEWSAPVVLDSTSYLAYKEAQDGQGVQRPINGEPENRFGDYFGFQAYDGVLFVAYQKLSGDYGKSYIAFTEACYASGRGDGPVPPPGALRSAGERCRAH